MEAPAANSSKPGVILGIQYLRGFAAMTVVWLHALASTPSLLNFLGDAYFGGTGVDLFFVISGFIMVVTTAKKALTPVGFFVMRLERVAPLYWLVTLAAIGMAPFGHHFKGIHLSTAAIVKSLGFIPYESLDFPGQLWPIVIPGWTLDYEMFFYAVFAVCLVFRRWNVLATTGAIALLVIAGYIDSPPPTSPARVYTNPLMLEFVSGMWVGWVYLKGRWMPSWFTWVAVPVGLYLMHATGARWEMPMGAILLVVAMMSPAVGLFRPLLALGDASYSIYLIHPFVLSVLAAVWVRVFHPESLGTSVAFISLACASSAVAGYVCHRLVERPVTKFLRRLVDRLRTKFTRPIGAHPTA